MTEWIYENNSDNTSRYVLGTKGNNPLFVFGINPSTAEPNNLDPTLRRVSSFALSHGYDSWVMFNVYPYRDKDPDNLPLNLDDTEHETNVRLIHKVLSEYQTIDIWAAFGNNIFSRDNLMPYWKNIVHNLSDFDINWLATTVNVSGAPKHPLYEKVDKEFIPFDMNRFIDEH